MSKLITFAFVFVCISCFSQSIPAKLYIYDSYINKTLSDAIHDPTKTDQITINSKAQLDSFIIALDTIQFPNLKKLEIVSVDITQFPKSLCTIGTIEELYLKFNKLSSLPNEFALLNSIKILNIEDNNFTEIPPILGKMNSLTVLKLGGNRITNINEELFNLTGLTDLYFSAVNTHYVENDKVVGNPIQKLPDNIINLKALKRLDIRATGITSFSADQIEFLRKNNVAITHENKQLDRSSSKNLVKLTRSRTKTDFGKFESYCSYYTTD